MTDVLIYHDSERSPELRHEVPHAIIDPFFYVERNGSRHIVIGSLDLPGLREIGGFELHPTEEFGRDELVAKGLPVDGIRNEMALRICRGLGVESAVVPFWFPTQLADHLRANGIELRPDRAFFSERRRVKSGAELEGIRRAQKAANAGMGAARDLLRQATQNGSSLTLDGEPLTCERIKLAILQTFMEHDCTAESMIVAHGAQAAVGHDMGSGPIAPGESVVIDIWPRHTGSGCYADMTRTFVVGEPPDEVVEWHRVTLQALERSLAEIRAGVRGRAVFDACCEVIEGAGYPTMRTKEQGKVLDEGFFHGLGHGVGLEVHEEPGMGLVDEHELVAGDVVTVEPGLYRQGYGGVRLEDLVIVSESGIENLTDFPYQLEP